MKEPIEGESAFPCDRFGMSGMTLRQYYIGKALQGFCANPCFTEASYGDIAGLAIAQADEVMDLLFPQPEKENDVSNT